MTLRFYTYILISLMTALAAIADNNMEYTLKRAMQHNEKREYAASAELLDHYIDNTQKLETRKDSTLMAKLLRLQGDNFYRIGVATKAADLYEQALKISESLKDAAQTALLCNELFIIHFNSGNTSLSQDLLNRSLELFQSLNDIQGQCKVLNNLAILHYTLEDYPKSLEYYNQALSLAEKNPDLLSHLRPTMLSNLAELHTVLKDYNTANKYLDQAIELNQGRYDTQEALQTWLNKASLMNETGNKEEARKILRTVGKNIASEDPYLMSSACQQIARLHLELGDSINGLRWTLKAQHLADSLHTKEENEQLQQILVRYNSERIADHNKFLEINVKRQTTVNRIMIALIVVVLAFVIFLIYKMRLDKHKNQLIRSQREQLMEFERLEHDRKEQEFREQLDHKNRQLTSYSIDAASISELHKILIDSLRRMRSGASQATYNEINENISRIQNFNRSEVNDFRVYFNEVHPDLLNTLSERYPSLTSNDLRLCSFLYLGMTTKEIASLTFREIRSVESSRLRLRKKLGIQGEQTLHNFLHSL